MLADMHIHSVFSDGTMTPAEIVRRAQENGVGLIAVCDHNVVQGSIEAEPIARRAGLGFLPGVELDVMGDGLNCHVLCYGADFSDAALLARVRHARARLDAMSDDLLERMLPDYPQLDADEYRSRAHDTSRGGWKLLQYLTDKGITQTLRGGLGFYAQYGVTYESAGFHDAESVIRAIHAAGGTAVLAHPGVMFGSKGREPFLRSLEVLRECGIDGVECHYVKHSAELTEWSLGFCARHDLLITAGSDCHGAFERFDIGQTRTPVSALKLGPLQAKAWP